MKKSTFFQIISAAYVVAAFVNMCFIENNLWFIIPVVLSFWAAKLYGDMAEDARQSNKENHY